VVCRFGVGVGVGVVVVPRCGHGVESGLRRVSERRTAPGWVMGWGLGGCRGRVRDEARYSNNV
jgi:hypothetical protein